MKDSLAGVLKAAGGITAAGGSVQAEGCGDTGKDGGWGGCHCGSLNAAKGSGSAMGMTGVTGSGADDSAEDDEVSDNAWNTSLGGSSTCSDPRAWVNKPRICGSSPPTMASNGMRTRPAGSCSAT